MQVEFEKAHHGRLEMIARKEGVSSVAELMLLALSLYLDAAFEEARETVQAQPGEKVN